MSLQKADLTLGLALLAAGPLVAAQTATGSLQSTDDIHVVSFKLDAGTIYVNLPRDLRAGEKASGTPPSTNFVSRLYRIW